MPGLYDVFLGCSARLAHVAKGAFGAHLEGRIAAPARYVWVPTGDRFDLSGGLARGGRMLHTQLAGVDVVITGRTYGEAEGLRAALVTALRYEMGGPAYELGPASWRKTEEKDASWELTQAIVLKLPLYRMDLPDSGPTPVAPSIDEDRLAPINEVNATGEVETP